MPDDMVMLETVGAAVLTEAEAERDRAAAQARLDYAAALRAAALRGRVPPRFTIELGVRALAGGQLTVEVQMALQRAESQDNVGRAVVTLHADAVALRVYNRCAGVCFPNFMMGGMPRIFYLFSAFTPAPESEPQMETRFPVDRMVIMDGYGVPDELPAAAAQQHFDALATP